METCPLCHSKNTRVVFKHKDRGFLECSECDLLFCEPRCVVSYEEELQRYRAHNNNIADQRYVAHLSKLTNQLLPNLPPGSTGLDYGCGHTPVLSALLSKEGHQMSNYDPFFGFTIPTDQGRFDFITCTEAMEHFVEPRVELLRIQSLLKPGGLLGVMTGMRDAERRSPDWWYLRDPTHRTFYSTKTINFIAAWLEAEVLAQKYDTAIFRFDTGGPSRT